MTDPLIDPTTLLAVVNEQIPWGTQHPDVHYAVADAVLDYLRSVLTPEALWDVDESADSRDIGDLLHRRIFEGRTND